MMKKLILIVVTGGILISCVLISTLATSTIYVNKTSAEQTATDAKEYVIGIREGRIAVFRQGEDKPFLVTDTFANTLPRSDRNELSGGVEVTGEKELRKALEEYCS